MLLLCIYGTHASIQIVPSGLCLLVVGHPTPSKKPPQPKLRKSSIYAPFPRLAPSLMTDTHRRAYSAVSENGKDSESVEVG